MRSQRGQVWPYLLLTVAFLAALSFGGYQTRLKNQFARDAENKYMSAFHRLKWTSENIEERMTRLMATNDPRLQESLLADLRVFSAQAVEHLAVLPFTTMNTPRLTNFLNTLRMESDTKHHQLSQGGRLEAADWETMNELRQQAVFLEQELSELLGLVGNNLIRWQPTVQATSPAQTGPAPTPITQSVLEMEKGIPVPPGEENAMAPGIGPLPTPKMDLGARIDPPTAVANIKRFMDMPLKQEPALSATFDTQNQQGGLSLYYYDVVKANGLPLHVGVTIHGGHVIYALDGRPVTERKLGRNELVQKGRELLRKWGYATVEFISAVDNDGTLVMDFAPVENGVSIRTELIKLSLAMDNGEFTGFDARNYWINRQPRPSRNPGITATDAKGRISPRLQAEGEPQLALVADGRGNERLAWEVRARLDDQRFKIFIDAADGREVDVQRVEGDPAPPLGEG